MNNENNKETNVKSTINAITGLVQAIPIYHDAVQPAAREIGKSLATVTKTINIALAPVSALVWGFEKIQDYVLKRVSEKLQNRPECKIVSPDPVIVGPSLEALRFTGNDVDLRELYASLIATSMDADSIQNAHPGFVEIIKNLSSDEARLMKLFFFNDRHALLDLRWSSKDTNGEFDLKRNVSVIGEKAGTTKINLTPNYIDNLCRLGLMEIQSDRYLADDKLYEEINNLDFVKQIKEEFSNMERQLIFKKKHISITDFGLQFCIACITL